MDYDIHTLWTKIQGHLHNTPMTLTMENRAMKLLADSICAKVNEVWNSAVMESVERWRHLCILQDSMTLISTFFPKHFHFAVINAT